MIYINKCVLIPAAAFVLLMVVGTAAIQPMVTFCGAVTASEASGASGYFQLNFVQGMAQYGYHLDLSKFDFTGAMGADAAAVCNPGEGLTWHLHTYWTAEESGSAAGTQCAMTGGHYDPNLACSEKSQSHDTLCPPINRTAGQGYAYTCNPTIYKSGLYAYCETGDLSGKFGVATETSPDSLIYSHEDVYTDMQPPYWSNYGHSWPPVSVQWASVVFHCADSGAQVACASLVQQPKGVMTCTPGDGETYENLSELDYCIFGASVLVLLYGVYYKANGRGKNNDNGGHCSNKGHHHHHYDNMQPTESESNASLPSNYGLDDDNKQLMR